MDEPIEGTASRAAVVEVDGIIYGDYEVPEDAASWSPPKTKFGDAPARAR